MSTIYRIVTEEQWEDAQRSGFFAGSEHDHRDGFIHFSTAAQVQETAAKHYAGKPRLLLLYVTTDALSAPLKWEPARNQDLFPHLYGSLPLSAVQRVEPLPLGPDGRHVFPALTT